MGEWNWIPSPTPCLPHQRWGKSGLVDTHTYPNVHIHMRKVTSFMVLDVTQLCWGTFWRERGLEGSCHTKTALSSKHNVKVWQTQLFTKHCLIVWVFKDWHAVRLVRQQATIAQSKENVKIYLKTVFGPARSNHNATHFSSKEPFLILRQAASANREWELDLTGNIYRKTNRQRSRWPTERPGPDGLRHKTAVR